MSCTQEEKENWKRTRNIIIAVCIAVFAIAIAIALFFYYKQKETNKRRKNKETGDRLNQPLYYRIKNNDIGFQLDEFSFF